MKLMNESIFDVLISDFVLVNAESFFSKPTFPLLHFSFIELFEPCRPSDQQLSSSQFELFIGLLCFLLESLSSFVFCFGFEPICSTRNALNFFSILFGFVILFVDLDSFLDDVHFDLRKK